MVRCIIAKLPHTYWLNSRSTPFAQQGTKMVILNFLSENASNGLQTHMPQIGWNGRRRRRRRLQFDEIKRLIESSYI